jgi:hypothetical protein
MTYSPGARQRRAGGEGVNGRGGAELAAAAVSPSRVKVMNRGAGLTCTHPWKNSATAICWGRKLHCTDAFFLFQNSFKTLATTSSSCHSPSPRSPRPQEQTGLHLHQPAHHRKMRRPHTGASASTRARVFDQGGESCNGAMSVFGVPRVLSVSNGVLSPERDF